MKTVHLALLAATLAVGTVWAEPLTSQQRSHDLILPPILPTQQLSGNFDLATRLVREAAAAEPGASAAPAASPSSPTMRSPKRAFLLSALMPGSGELWAGSKMRSAVFFGLEVVGWGTYVSWNSKGDDLEQEFRARADSTWNPWNYLAWLGSSNSRFTSKTHELPCGDLFDDAPTSTPVPEVLGPCSSAETQQYYELIGKYDQFIAGWEDLTDGVNRVHYAEVDSAENFASTIRLEYEDQRNDSNRFLKRASNVGGLLLVNHVLSAIDAARVARARNLGQDEAVIDRRTRIQVALGGSDGRTPLLMAWRPFD